MNNKMQKLELENTLNQIYRNNDIYDGSIKTFSFCKINFITLNSLNIYVKQCNITFYREYLKILVNDIIFEIRYSDIRYLLINLGEA